MDARRRAAITEPIPTESEFVSGLAHAHCIGGVLHLAFFIEEVLPPELGTGVSRRIRRRLIMPIGAAPRMLRILQLTVAGDTDASQIETSATTH